MDCLQYFSPYLHILFEIFCQQFSNKIGSQSRIYILDGLKCIHIWPYHHQSTTEMLVKSIPPPSSVNQQININSNFSFLLQSAKCPKITDLQSPGEIRLKSTIYAWKQKIESTYLQDSCQKNAFYKDFSVVSLWIYCKVKIYP